jgi:DNA polymerase III epsilon subunit-like protein
VSTIDVALRRLTRATRWVVLDVETTNSDSGKHVVSVGVHQWRNDPTDAQPTPAPTEWFIDPGVPIENTRIHGITNAYLTQKQAPPFANYQRQLDRVLTPRRGENVVLVAHYARFDVGVLHLEYGRLGATLPDVPVLDTWELARWLEVGSAGHTLKALLDHYELPLTRHHNAAADAHDTAALLRKLLREAASQQVDDLAAEHPSTRKPAVMHRPSAYPAAPPHRGLRASRQSRFSFIERPKDHELTHKSLPKTPSAPDLEQWLADARICITLRCPGLPAKADNLRTDREAMAREFLGDLDRHQNAGEQVSANSALSAALVLLPKVTGTADAPLWVSRWAPKLEHTSRCAEPGTDTLSDGCPDCRADRGCPADLWRLTTAMLLVGAGRNFNARNSKSWLTPTGRLADLKADGYPDLAGHAAWLLYEMLSNQSPDKASAVADLARSIGITHPRLVHVHARTAELAGHPGDALRVIAAALSGRNKSSDRAWADLLAYRDSVQARQVAAARLTGRTRSYRIGHSAPADRPDRLRFRLTLPTQEAARAPAPKAMARKRRAARAGR